MDIQERIQALRGRFTKEEIKENLRATSTGPNASDPLMVRTRAVYQGLYDLEVAQTA